MPRKGIANQITVAIERPQRVARTFAWPPQVDATEVQPGFEGLPSRIGVYQASSRIGTREVFVFVFFGRGRPTVRQLSEANSELRRARLG